LTKPPKTQSSEVKFMFARGRDRHVVGDYDLNDGRTSCSGCRTIRSVTQV
jgi:hypothetical protein